MREVNQIVLRGEKRLQRVETDIIEVHQVDGLNEICIVLYKCIGIVLHKWLSTGLNHGIEIRCRIRLVSLNCLSGIVLLISRSMVIHAMMIRLIGGIDRVGRQG